jgi:hypothetical protein
MDSDGYAGPVAGAFADVSVELLRARNGEGEHPGAALDGGGLGEQNRSALAPVAAWTDSANSRRSLYSGGTAHPAGSRDGPCGSERLAACRARRPWHQTLRPRGAGVSANPVAIGAGGSLAEIAVVHSLLLIRPLPIFACHSASSDLSPAAASRRRGFRLAARCVEARSTLRLVHIRTTTAVASRRSRWRPLPLSVSHSSPPIIPEHPPPIGRGLPAAPARRTTWGAGPKRPPPQPG